MFSQVSVIQSTGGVHGRRGLCGRETMHGRGIMHVRGSCMAGWHACQGVMHGGLAYVAGGPCIEGGHACRAGILGTCMAGETVAAVDDWFTSLILIQLC